MQIITDSTSDLPKALVNELQIKVVPLLVTLGGETYADGVDINQASLFRLVDEVGELPKTAAPSVGSFLKIFKQDEESIYIGLSAALSSTVQNAQLAANELGEDHVQVIDSANLSTGLGLLVLKAVDLYKQGYTLKDIALEINRLKEKVHTSFALKTLKYLYMGGRCTALQSIVSSTLRINPIIEVRGDGTLGVKSKVRGNRLKVLKALLADFEQHLETMDLTRVAVTHTDSRDDAAFLAHEIKKLADPQQIIINEAGSVISSHCGPGTIGIIYLTK